jgi:hypothetical protein
MGPPPPPADASQEVDQIFSVYWSSLAKAIQWGSGSIPTFHYRLP